jgi:cytoskeletal protein CcmA (bactofilin family)
LGDREAERLEALICVEYDSGQSFGQAEQGSAHKSERNLRGAGGRREWPGGKRSFQNMWKFTREEEKTANNPSPATRVASNPAVAQQATPVQKSSAVTPKEAYPVETKPAQNYRPDVAHIGKSVVVKGELSGSEDLYLDGEVEGSIELNEHSLIIGPNGKIRANVRARDIIVHGKVDGNLYGGERVELKKSAVLVGDVFTQRIAIEDGAYFKGGIDIQKIDSQKSETKASAAAATSAPPSQNP